VDASLEAVDKPLQVTTMSRSSLTQALAHAGLWHEVLELLQQMPSMALRPSAQALQVPKR